ncbi:uncharacterized protein LOC127193659 [Acomys russatus]|uniref:uncharacterized protein LOC127193659 n=1 Tax=Acomys russatus TaxID=60746 RepID=UPI0021E2BC76|nr:uncharacterized protein LOC127193659 [Acomys russatus]
MLRSRAGLGLQQAASAFLRKKEKEQEGEEDSGSGSHDRHHQAEEEFAGSERAGEGRGAQDAGADQPSPSAVAQAGATAAARRRHVTRGRSCPRAERARTRGAQPRAESAASGELSARDPPGGVRSCACTQKPDDADKGGSGARATLRAVAVSEPRAASDRGSAERTGLDGPGDLGEARRTRVGQPPGARLPDMTGNGICFSSEMLSGLGVE